MMKHLPQLIILFFGKLIKNFVTFIIMLKIKAVMFVENKRQIEKAFVCIFEADLLNHMILIKVHMISDMNHNI